MKKLLYLATLTAFAACAQTLDLSHLDRLAEKTGQVVNVTLDEGLIKLAASFIRGNDPELKDIRGILPNLRGIYVRSFEFDSDNNYTQADVDKIEAQLKGWSTIVEVREGRKKEHTKIAMRPGGGLVVLTYGPRELTVVNIAGNITADQLEKLGGHLGIPEIDVKKNSGSKKSGKDKPEEDEEDEEDE